MRYAFCVTHFAPYICNMNPFLLNKYIGPEYFCDRVKETKEIIAAIDSGRSITLYADRRLGKTALIKHILHKLASRKPKYITAYVDVFDTIDEASFAKKLVSQVITEVEKGEKNIFNTATKYFSAIKPKLSFDPITNMPEFSFDLQTEKEIDLTLSTLFSYLGEKNRNVVIAIDEFQQINEYKKSRLAATIRSYIQNTPNVTYIFSGSKKHTLINMFSSPNQPFFNSTQLYPLHKINNQVYEEFIAKHFLKAKKRISSQHIKEILDWTYTHTSNVQEFCSRLYELETEEISAEHIKTVKSQIFFNYEQVYFNYRELLTFTQWQVLKAVGLEDQLSKPSSKAFLSKYNLGAQSSVKRALAALVDNDMVSVQYDENENKVYFIQDVFLRRWFQYKYRVN